MDGSVNYEYKVDVPVGPIKEGTSKVDDLNRSIEKLNTHGGKHAESLEHKIRHSMGGVGHAVNYVKNETHDLLETLGLVLAFELGEKIVDKLLEIGKEAINAAAAAERMDVAFKLSLGEEAGGEMVEAFEKIAGHSEFTETQLKGWGKQLLNAGVAADDLNKFIAAGLDVAAKSPDKMEGMQKAIMALSRASMTGSVDMRQLRGLSIGVDQLRTLPKFANLSLKQLKKEMTDGKLTKEDLLTVIAGPDKILGDLGVQAGKTLEARLTHLKAIPEEIFAKLRHTEAFDRLSTAIGHVLEKLDPDGPLAKKILAGLETLVGTFADVIESIDFDEVGRVITEDVVPAFQTMLGLIKPTIEAIERVIRGFGKMHDMITGGDTTSGFGERVGRGFAKMGAKLSEVVGGPVVGAIGGKLAGSIGSGMSGGMDKAAPMVKEGGAKLGGAAIEGTKDKIEAHSPSVVFEDIGGMVAAGFAGGISGGADMVGAAVDRMLRAPRVGMAAAPGGGGVSLSIGPVEVHVHGRGTEEDGQAAARGFAAELRPQFLDLLEQIRAEMGA